MLDIKTGLRGLLISTILGWYFGVHLTRSSLWLTLVSQSDCLTRVPNPLELQIRVDQLGKNSTPTLMCFFLLLLCFPQQGSSLTPQDVPTMMNYKLQQCVCMCVCGRGPAVMERFCV